jgi:hypothetical protein
MNFAAAMPALANTEIAATRLFSLVAGMLMSRGFSRALYGIKDAWDESCGRRRYRHSLAAAMVCGLFQLQGMLVQGMLV